MIAQQKAGIFLFVLVLLIAPFSFATPAPCLDNQGREIPCGWKEGDFPVSDSGVAVGFGVLFVAMMVLFAAMVVGLMALWVWMLVDCIRRDSKDKVLWILIILLTHLVGAIVYYFVVYRAKKPARVKSRGRKKK